MHYRYICVLKNSLFQFHAKDRCCHQLYYGAPARLMVLNFFSRIKIHALSANICILFSSVYHLFSGKKNAKTLNARPTFASLVFAPLVSRCLLLRRRYFILGPCINSAIQRFTFKALEQSGKPHSGKYSRLFAFSGQLGEKWANFASRFSFRGPIRSVTLRIFITSGNNNKLDHGLREEGSPE